MLRAQEIGRYVEQGAFDAGITGLDWLRETDASVVEYKDLVYAKNNFEPTRLVLAVNQSSKITSLSDLTGKKIATEFPVLTKRFLADNNIWAEVEFSWGATEAKVPGLVDAIVDITSTGESLRVNGLGTVAVLLVSTPTLIVNQISFKQPDIQQRILRLADNLTTALSSYKELTQIC